MALIVLSAFGGISGLARDEDATKIGGKSASDWVSALRSDDPKVRAEASLALELFGPAARRVVPALIDALDDPRRDVQFGAAWALREIGPDAAAAAPALVRKLGTGVFGIGDPWSEALVAIGPAVVPSLIECLQGVNKAAYLQATKILAAFGPAARDAVPALARLVDPRDHGLTEGAVSALGRIGPDASAAVPALFAAYESLKPDDGHLRNCLLDAFAKIAGPPIPRMIRALDDPDPDRRADAAMILGYSGAKARSAAGRLEVLIDDPSPDVRLRATLTLLDIDPANPRVLPALAGLLDSRNIDVLDEVIPAITKLGSRGAVVVPGLKKIIARPDLTSPTQPVDDLRFAVSLTKASAAEALIAVAPDSGEGVAALIALLKAGADDEHAAVEVLGRLGPRASAAVPALITVAQNTKSYACLGAIRALIRVEEGDEAILPALLELLTIEPDPLKPDEFVGVVDERDKVSIMVMTGRMGVRARPAVPSLVRILSAKRGGEENEVFYEEQRVAAARALGRIGPAAKSAVPFLIKEMRTERRDYDARTAAARALCAMGKEAVPAVPDLVAMLESEPYLSSLATQVLGSIGPEARAAVPALINRLNGKDHSVAASAGAALLRIDPSRRNLIEARLRSIPVNHLYAWAILSGALGRRTPEADGFARLDIRTLDSSVHTLVGLTGEDDLWIQDFELQKIESVLERLSRLGTGAEGATGRLAELTHHPDPEIRRLASEALKRIRPG